MFKHKIKLIIVGALLAIGVAGPGSRSEASLLLNTPTGLADGAQFRFVFVTPGTRNATSTSIGDYNSFVNTQAGGATYGGTVVNWYAIASTSAVTAKNNITGLQTTPIYLANGTKVANDLSTNSGGLWGVTVATPLQSPINYMLTGQVGTGRNIWTGSNLNGTGLSGFELGSGFSFSAEGLTSGSDSQWIQQTIGSSATALSLYGISEVLTVQTSAVPEPSTYALFCISLGVVGFARRKMGKQG